MDPNLGLDLDPSFEPQQRARSNTWPLPRPDNFVDIKEEDEDVVVDLEHLGSNTHLASCGPGSAANLLDPLGLNGSSVGLGCGGTVNGTNGNATSASAAAAAAAAAAKKNSSRRNAWGNMSYADLITQAIQNSPDKRLTLSQIYDWMVQNVPYFKDKGDSNSSAGWKNSIRHNLSLHNRFMRVQNEGTGKSSWWMINPDAKPGKSARRRATSMETSKYEKKRGRVKKKVEALRAGLTTTPSPSSSISEGLDMFPESPQLHPVLGGFQLSPGDFRPRASSNASSVGGRLSPIPALGLESDLLEPWSPEYATPALYRHSAHPHVASLEPRFNTDQLVDNLSESMKIRENGFRVASGSASNDGDGLLANNFSFPTTLPQPSQPPQPPQHSQSQHASAGFSYAAPPSYVNDAKRSPQRLLNSAHADVPPPPYMPSLQALSPSQQTNPLHLSPDVMRTSPTSGYRSPSLTPFDTTTATLLRAALGQSTGNNGSVSLKEEAMVTPSQMMSQLMGALNNNGPMPQDLDLSLDTLQGGFDCNVDEVIKHELSMDGSLDFNFPHMGGVSSLPTTLTSCSSSPSSSSVNSSSMASSTSPYGLPPAFMSSTTLEEMLGVSPSTNTMPPPLCPITTSMSTGRSWVR